MSQSAVVMLNIYFCKIFTCRATIVSQSKRLRSMGRLMANSGHQAGFSHEAHGTLVRHVAATTRFAAHADNTHVFFFSIFPSWRRYRRTVTPLCSDK